MKRIIVFYFFIGINSLFSQYNIQNLDLISHYIPNGGSAYDVSFMEENCFIISDSVLEIIEISDIETPKFISKIDSITGRKIEVERIGATSQYYAFVKPLFLSSKGLDVLNVSNITDVKKDTLWFPQEIINDFYFLDDILFTVTDSSLKAYYIEFANNNIYPTILSEIKTKNKNQTVIINDYAYLGQENGIAVVDISDLRNLKLLNEFSDYENDCPWNMDINKGLVYNNFLVTIGGLCQQIFAFDITDPILPTQLDYSPLIMSEYDPLKSIIMQNEYLYFSVSANNGGLYMVDLTDPLVPVMAGYFRNSPKPGGLSVKIYNGNIFYCGLQNNEQFPENQQGGLFILRNELITQVNEQTNIPKDYKLKQNYPNPFNPTTQIKYTLAEDGIVTLTIFNTLGEKVDEVINEFQSAGSYNVKYSATNLSSGIYFYRLKSKKFSESKKMLLLR